MTSHVTWSRDVFDYVIRECHAAPPPHLQHHFYMETCACLFVMWPSVHYLGLLPRLIPHQIIAIPWGLFPAMRRQCQRNLLLSLVTVMFLSMTRGSVCSALKSEIVDRWYVALIVVWSWVSVCHGVSCVGFRTAALYCFGWMGAYQLLSLVSRGRVQ